MVENYDILLTDKGWDSLDVDQIMTSKLFLGKENPLKEQKLIENLMKKNEKTPDDDICVICFDKKIQLILNKCLVIFIFFTKFPLKSLFF